MRRPPIRWVLGLAVLLVYGCGADDQSPPGAEVLATFEPGTPRDEVVEALPDGGVTPSRRVDEGELLHGYVFESFLLGPGRVEVLWVHDAEAGLPETAEELRDGLNPVLFVDGELDGWGWENYETRMESWGLPEQWSIPTASGEAPPPRTNPPVPGGGEAPGDGFDEDGGNGPEEGVPSPAPGRNDNRMSVPENTSNRV